MKKKPSLSCNATVQRRVWPKLPKRVFISHAYKDSGTKDKLLKQLPKRVQPIIFSLQDPDPHEAVSNGIVAAIHSCKALIYLQSELSKESLWVKFERDYALRSGLKVYSYNEKRGSLLQDGGSPTPLRIELVIGEDKDHRATHLLKWMKTERSFDFHVKPTHLKMKEIPMFVARLIQEKRVVVWLMDGHIHGVASLALEIPPDMLCEEFGFGYNEADFEDYADWLRQHSMYVRLSPDWQPELQHSDDPEERVIIQEAQPIESLFQGGWAVDLVSQSDKSKLDWNRADDLIVRTTFMIQQSQPFFTDEDKDM